MKKTLFILALAFAASQSCSQKLNDIATVNFAGQTMETKEIQLQNFSGISVATAIKMHIVKSDSRKIVIRSNAMQYVAAEVKNGTLSVHYENRNRSMNNASTEVTLYTPDFSSIDVSSAASVSVEDHFKQNKLSLEASSAGKITGNFEAEKIQISASSAAKCEGTVKAESLQVEASSSAKVTLAGVARNVQADASSTGKIDLENLKYTSIQKDESSLGKVSVK